MFCPKCGTQNEDEAAFCGKCGATLKNQETGSVPQGTLSAVTHVTEDAQTSMGGVSMSVPLKAKSPKKSKAIIAIVALIAVIAIIVGIVVSCSGANKELPEGTYKAEAKDGYYGNTLSMDIASENKVTITAASTYRYSSDTSTSISGEYEFVASVDGSNVYAITNIKLPSGQFATLSDISSAFGGGSGSDYAFESIDMILPEGYENGDIEGRWGFVRTAKSSTGEVSVVGGVAVVNSDGTGSMFSINRYEQGLTALDVLTDSNLSAESGQTFKVTKNAPGRYTLVYDEYGNSLDLTIPVKE